MIPLTQDQIKILRDLGFEQIVIANSYTTFQLLRTLGEAKLNEALVKLGIAGDFATYRNKGNLADIVKFREFLKFSEVYRAALLAGQATPAVRKLVFELTFWISSEVGEASPSTVLAVWNELNAFTRGAIKASVSAAGITAWNNAITDCLMMDGFKL